MANAERMVPVAELLRREGVRPASQPAKRGRIAASAAGVVAVCGAAVTGIVGLAPTLSTPLFLGDNGFPQPDAVSGGGDSRTSARPTTNDSSPFVQASMQHTTTRPEPRKPAMSWLADDVTSDRTASPAEQPTRAAPASDAPAASRPSTAPSDRPDQSTSPGASGQHRQNDQAKPDGGEQPPEQRSGQDGTQEQGQESEQPSQQPEEHGNSQQGGPPPEDERGNSAEHRNNGQADAEHGKPADPGQSSGNGKSGLHGR